LNRLSKGPLCHSDWRTTGINSYSTVSNTLRFLHQNGLVEKKRQGHKMMYSLATNEEIVPIFGGEHGLKIFDGWFFLTTTKKQRDRMGTDRRAP